MICFDQTCTPPPPCSPGQIENCGNCGTRVCNQNNEWDPCTGEGACSPGQTQVTGSCELCGDMEAVCESNCQFGPPQCVNQGVCEANTEEAGGHCGTCGTDRRSCLVDCTWSAWWCDDQPHTRFYEDRDGDGYGDPNSYVDQCSLPTGYVTNDQDCADWNRDINPGASAVCGDCYDNNCTNGEVPCDSSAYITLNPPSPGPHEDVTVNVYSQHGWACVLLTVTGPNGFSGAYLLK